MPPRSPCNVVVGGGEQWKIKVVKHILSTKTLPFDQVSKKNNIMAKVFSYILSYSGNISYYCISHFPSYRSFLIIFVTLDFINI